MINVVIYAVRTQTDTDKLTDTDTDAHSPVLSLFTKKGMNHNSYMRLNSVFVADNQIFNCASESLKVSKCTQIFQIMF